MKSMRSVFMATPPCAASRVVRDDEERFTRGLVACNICAFARYLLRRALLPGLASQGEFAELRDALVATPPRVVSKPQRMIWMPRTGRPRRIDERVVKVLLHLIDETLRERRIVVDGEADLIGEVVDVRFM